MNRRYLIAGALVVGLTLAAQGEPPTVEQRLEQLEQEIRSLKRHRELEQEAAATKPKSPVGQVDAKGFSLRSADRNFQLKLRGYVQADSRWYLEDAAQAGQDGFLLRRVRPIFEGTLWQEFDFRIIPEFGGGSTALQDAYLGWNHWSEFRLRAGQFKAPVGLERLQSGTELAFNERALPTELLPNRDVGVQVHGALWDGVLEYAVGVFNGVVDGGSTGGSNASDDFELAGRLFTQPFRKTACAPLQGLGLGVAGTIGDENGTPAAPQVAGYRTPGQARFFRYLAGTPASAANTVVANGDRWRLTPQGYYYWGPFGLLGEYAIAEQELSIGPATAHLQNTAWQVTASWVLTGEAASYRGVKPKQPFDLKTGHWGAFEVVGRYQEFDVDNAAFPTFASPTVSATQATGWSVGMNWYLNANLKAQLSYSQTTFTGGAPTGDRADEKVFFTRLQVNF